MFERVQCPSCSAPYGLKPHRVRREHRRALCFKCGGVFPIGDAVARLLGESPAARVPEPLPAPAWDFEPEDRLAQSVESSPVLSEAAAAIAAPWDLDIPEPPPLDDPGAATLGIPAPELEAARHASEAQVTEDVSSASLSLDDLMGAEEEILEKTLHGVVYPPTETQPVSMSSVPPPPAQAPPSPMSAGEGGYASAADAISRLMGGVATPEHNRPRPLSTSMDLEATLSALETSLKGPVDFDGPTLGGQPSRPAIPGITAPQPLTLPDVEPELGTVQLSSPQLMAAMRSATQLEPELPEPLERTLILPTMTAPPRASMMPPSMDMEATRMIVPPASVAPLAAPDSGIATPPITMGNFGAAGATVQYPSPTLQMPTPALPSASSSGEYDPNLLKVQIGTDVMSNLHMDQVVRMVEAGDIQDFHLVARQFSENWLEASKVPALRPIFERMRRARPVEPLPPPPISETAPIKKSLFGGLFGKKE